MQISLGFGLEAAALRFTRVSSGFWFALFFYAASYWNFGAAHLVPSFARFSRAGAQEHNTLPIAYYVQAKCKADRGMGATTRIKDELADKVPNASQERPQILQW